ncbi:MAG: hypothetical protein KJ066_17645 [Acidobacteria bacterium]|nr:hypothetical protein [Acidobacteriota bacterium]
MNRQRACVSLAAATVVLACAAMPTGAEAQARAVDGKHARVEVIAAADAPDPAGALWLGVRFTMEPGWHIYWVNPGDSGGPPTALWHLPPGVAADGFLWPAPERIPLGPLVNYGYKGDVVLPVALRVPAAARGQAITGSVDLRWLICKDICIPDRATLAFALPLPAAERHRLAAWRQQIADARAAVPTPAPRGWKTSVTSTRDALVVAIATDRTMGGATFFPIDEGVIDESAPQRVDVKGTAITFTLQKSVHLLTLPARLRGVVVLASGEAFEVSGAVADATRGSLSSRE